jgi:hypothetical protein
VEEPPQPAVVFEQPSVQRGRIRGGREYQQEFCFRVWDRGPITIDKVETCCGTSLASEELLGKPMQPGTKNCFTMRFRSREELGTRSLLAKVQTTPPSPAPLIIAIHYETLATPRPLVQQLVAEAWSTESAEAVLETVHWRKPTEATVNLIREKFESAHFELRDVKRSSEIAISDAYTGEKAVKDTTRIVLQAKHTFPPGQHWGNVVLRWDDGTEFSVPTILRIRTPISPANERLFTGFLTPGQEWKFSLPLRFQMETATEIASIHSSNPYIKATLGVDRRSIDVRVTAPNAVGRFEGEIVLRFRPESFPDCTIPVSGLVRKAR